MTKGIKFFLIALILSSAFWFGINLFQGNLEKFFYAQISQPFQEMTLVKFQPKPQKPDLELEVKSAISLKINKFGKEKILFKKDSNQVLPIASLTKLMTALVVLEDAENYNFSKVIVIQKEAADQENVPEYGNLKEDEEKSVEELLNLMLIYSSNDATWALSEIVGQSYFVERMNQKAESLGLQNTRFVNSTGIDPENLHWSKENLNYFNHSTVQDLSKIAKYILNEFPLIFEISIIKPGFSVKNGFLELSLTQNLIGGKTGYTDEAGGCMLLILEDEGNYIVNVILGTESSEARVREMQKLIDWLNI